MPRKAKPPPQAPYKTGEAGQGQAPAAPTGMPYGEHQAAIAAQQQVPLAGGMDVAPSAPPPTPDAGGAALGNAQILQAASDHPFDPVDLTAPPSSAEPLSAGLPIGPGPGPSVRPTANVASALDL